MLKRLAIVVVFLAVAQTALPIPRNAPDHPANASSGVQNSGNGNANPANKKPAATQPTQTVEEQYDGSTDAGENKPQPIAIREFPSVSISKDWADWSYWVFSGLLVLVGAFQAVLLWRTLGAIKKQAITMEAQATTMATQAGHMESQTKILSDSVAAAQKSADAAKLSADSGMGQFQAMKAKERARVWIEITGDLNLGMGPFAVPVAYTIRQTGPTDGFVFASFAKLVVSEVDPEVPQYSSINSIGIPNRVTPQFEKKIESMFLYRFTGEEIQRINAKTVSVYFMASIKYNDIFGDPHETSTMQRWCITDMKNLMGGYGNFAYWTPSGPPEANRET